MSDSKSKSLIHTLDVDSLVALAAGATPEDISDKLTESAKFIYDLNIKHGNTEIPASLIFHTYQCWKGWDQKKQSKPIFFRDFSKHFPPGRNASGRVYLLNPKPFDLSESTKWIVRKELREAKKQRNKKK